MSDTSNDTAGQGYYTSVRDPALNFLNKGLNARTAMISIGKEGDPDAPNALVIHVNPGPGDPLRGRHVHHTDAINLVIEGSMYIDGDWIRPGQAKVVPAELNYGDQICGPDGVIFLEIFADFAGSIPDFVDPAHQAYFHEVHGQFWGKH